MPFLQLSSLRSLQTRRRSLQVGARSALCEEVTKIKKLAKEYIAKVFQKVEKSCHQPPQTSVTQATSSKFLDAPNSAENSMTNDIPTCGTGYLNYFDFSDNIHQLAPVSMEGHGQDAALT